MKKIVSILLTVVLLICSVSIVLTKPVYANTAQSAESITLNTMNAHTFSEYEYEHYYKFIPTETRYYEVYVNNFLEEETYITIYDSYGDLIAFTGWNEFRNDVIVGVKLKANQIYYIEIDLFTDYNKTAYTAIAKHEHTMKYDFYNKAGVYSNKYYYSGSYKEECLICNYYAYKNINAIKSITLSKTAYTYDGKEKRPTVTVKDTSGKTISSSNYTITYESGRKKVGKYKVTVKFKGNYYAGTKTLYYSINPKGTSISKLSATKKGFKVKYKKQATQTTGYQIRYSTSSKMSGAKTVTISKNSTVSKSISKLKSRKRYYVQIRTYKTVNGNKYYSAWSVKKSIKTK